MFIKTTDKSRRRILKYTVCGFFLGIFGLPTMRHTNDPNILAANPDALSLLPDSMREIGKEYLNSYPEERSRKVLVNSIQSRLNVMKNLTNEPSWADMKELITDDFQTDQVVYVKGWVLSRTEARLAALYIV